jgi:hypothetical protein
MNKFSHSNRKGKTGLDDDIVQGIDDKQDQEDDTRRQQGRAFISSSRLALLSC